MRLSTLLYIPASVYAHAFGQRYDLPVPLALYLWGAAAVVLLSFLVAVLFLGVPRSRERVLTIDIGDTWFGRVLTSAPVRMTLEGLSLALFLLVIATGAFGHVNTAKNFAPIFVWVIWWVGMAYVAAFLGNLWGLVNPWRILYRRAQRFVDSLARPRFEYPQRLGAWPAVALLFAFAYLEFISGVAQRPRTLAVNVIAYTLITFTGMRAFGREVWLRHGEVFSVLFGLMARFGLFDGCRKPSRVLTLRLPGSGLLNSEPVTTSLMAFTLLMLTAVSFDGFLETPLWASILRWATGFAATPADVVKLVKTLALVLFYGLFAGVYLVFSYLVASLSGESEGTLMTARTYVLSLVPIAIAYHLAHYLSYLLVAGQLIIPIASDPFGYGWNLFGTAAYRLDIGVIGAKQVWYLAVSAIVVGHIAAVCVAHVTALRRIGDRHRAIVAQLPMLVLMVGYTMISLWILSQPIVSH